MEEQQEWPARLEKIPRASGLGDSDARSSGWDIGEQPTNPMAHLMYPTFEFRATHGRSEDSVQSLPNGDKDKQSELERQAERNRSGWASPRKEPFKPLGEPLDFPPSGMQLRKKPSVATQYRQPKIVLPHEAKETEDTVTAVTQQLIADVPLMEERVGQFEYAHYSFELRERKVVVFSLESVTGDPDLFVSNKTRTPHQDEHTWKSARGRGMGDDVVTVSTDHPRYAFPCTYYVSVFGTYDSEYHISVRLQEEPLHLRFDASHLQPNGFGVLSELVAGAEQRRESTRFSSFGARELRGGAVESYGALPRQLQHAVQLGAVRKRENDEREAEAEAAADADAAGRGRDGRRRSEMVTRMATTRRVRGEAGHSAGTAMSSCGAHAPTPRTHARGSHMRRPIRRHANLAPLSSLSLSLSSPQRRPTKSTPRASMPQAPRRARRPM